jgi:hypothetical protein
MAIQQTIKIGNVTFNFVDSGNYNLGAPYTSVPAAAFLPAELTKMSTMMAGVAQKYANGLFGGLYSITKTITVIKGETDGFNVEPVRRDTISLDPDFLRDYGAANGPSFIDNFGNRVPMTLERVFIHESSHLTLGSNDLNLNYITALRGAATSTNPDITGGGVLYEGNPPCH